MKKFITMASMILLGVFCLAGCGNKDSAKDYFPAIENGIYEYTGEHTNSLKNIFDEYANGDKIQRKTSIQAGIDVTEVMILSDEEVKIKAAFVNVSGWDYTSHEGYTDMTILKAPFEVGNSWVKGVNNNVTHTSKIIEIDKEITVPAGTYKTLVIETKSDDGVTSVVDYLAKGVGLVKRDSVINGESIISELSKIDKDVPHSEATYIYFPNAENTIEFGPTNIEYSTNGNYLDSFNKGLSKGITEFMPEVKFEQNIINKLEFEDSEVEKPTPFKVKIDLSQEFFDAVNAVESKERHDAIILAMFLTARFEFNAEDLLFTVEGKQFKTAFLELSETEYTPATNFLE